MSLFTSMNIFTLNLYVMSMLPDVQLHHTHTHTHTHRAPLPSLHRQDQISLLRMDSITRR